MTLTFTPCCLEEVGATCRKEKRSEERLPCVVWIVELFWLEKPHKIRVQGLTHPWH